jgi:hypothetical protein
VDEPERDVETALHTAGVGLGDPSRGIGEADALEQLLDALPSPDAVESVDLCLHFQVLAAGRLRVEAVLLPDDPDRATHPLCIADDVEPGHPRLAAVCARERGQDPDGR